MNIKKYKNFVDGNNNEVINEASNDHFVVTKKTKRILRMNGNSYDYWQGEKAGSIDMKIEVFGYNHREEAKLIYNALKNAGLEDRYFSIKVETK